MTSTNFWTKHTGKSGTPERDEFERKVDESVHAWYMGEAIKKERIRQSLTQEKLGQRVGVKKSQISRQEKGTASPSLH